MGTLILLGRAYFYNYLFRHTVYHFSHSLSAIMDCSKIHDSQLSQRKVKSILDFLSKGQRSGSKQSRTINTTDEETEQQKPSRLSPKFSFQIQSYSIGEHVEYSVILLEKYKILGRPMVNKYRFKTRYSLLEALDKKLGGMGFPEKKFFGNKNPSFVEKRRVELQKFLNRVSRSKKTQFLRFVKQVKDCDFNLSLEKSFSLE